MRYIMYGKNIEVTEGLRTAVEEKFGKLSRYFTEDTEIHVTFSVEKELQKIGRIVKESGLTIVPTSLFINEKGLAKLNIAIARGKKTYDKRQSLKAKEDQRQMDRMFKR